MSKVRRLYHQKYRDDWERFPSFSSWLCRGDDGYSAHCKICDANVLARLASIKQHHNTAKHQKAIKSHSYGSKIITIKTEPEMREEQMTPKPMAQKIMITEKTNPKVKRFKTETIDHHQEHHQQQQHHHHQQIHQIEGADTCSNDSILEDLLGNDDTEHHEYLQEMSEQEMDQDIKSETLQEFKIDDIHEESMTEDILSEFDLFGKSVSLQLNNMDLEDALLCQERLQVVLTEFRLKILKRKAKRNF